MDEQRLMDAQAMSQPSQFQSSTNFGKGFLYLKNTKKNNSGQALLEYALLLVIAAGLSIGIVTTFSSIINGGVRQFNAVLESELRSGPPELIGVWEN